MKWARFHIGGYECSSAGDKRFSALFAVHPSGKTIEELYQLDIKGYRAITTDWRQAKGKPPINGKTAEELWEEYLLLWREWVMVNTDLILELRDKAKNGVLTDRFATSSINQARALATIITELEELEGIKNMRF